MAFLRKRANGMYSLAFWWKGKIYIKALGTDDEQAANEIKKDAEEQLTRIRRGETALASNAFWLTGTPSLTCYSAQKKSGT